MTTLPLRALPDPPLPLWREADDRWQLRSFGVSLGSGLFWGGALSFFGTWMMLGALRLVPFDLDGVRVPLPIFALIGAVISVSGLAIMGRALLDWRKERLARARLLQSPTSRALADHPWHPEKSEGKPWASAIRRTFWAGFIALFFTPFAWLFYTESASLVLRALLALFGITVLWMLFLAARAWLCALKFGPSSVRYASFPLRPGGTITLHWQVPAGCRLATSGHFTLRALEERLNHTQSRGRRRSSHTRAQLWATRLELTEPVVFRAHDEHALAFAVPQDAPGTWLSGGDTVRYWELAVELALDGLDFRECYLVPVYLEARAT